MGLDTAKYVETLKEEVVRAGEQAFVDIIEDGKIEPEDAVDLVVDLLDVALPLSQLVDGPIGEALEDADEAIFKKIIDALTEAFKPDPARILARAEKAASKGHMKIAERRRKRAERAAARQAARAEKD